LRLVPKPGATMQEQNAGFATASPNQARDGDKPSTWFVGPTAEART